MVSAGRALTDCELPGLIATWRELARQHGADSEQGQRLLRLAAQLEPLLPVEWYAPRTVRVGPVVPRPRKAAR